MPAHISSCRGYSTELGAIAVSLDDWVHFPSLYRLHLLHGEMAFYAHSVHTSTSAGLMGRCTEFGAEFGAPEQAKVHTYNDSTKKWSVEETTVRLSPSRFAEGTNRYCYKVCGKGVQQVYPYLMCPGLIASTV